MEMRPESSVDLMTIGENEHAMIRTLYMMRWLKVVDHPKVAHQTQVQHLGGAAGGPFDGGDGDAASYRRESRPLQRVPATRGNRGSDQPFGDLENFTRAPFQIGSRRLVVQGGIVYSNEKAVRVGGVAIKKTLWVPIAMQRTPLVQIPDKNKKFIGDGDPKPRGYVSTGKYGIEYQVMS